MIWLFFTPCLSASFPLLIKSMKSMIHSNSSSNPGYQVQSLIFGMFSQHLFKGLTSDMTCVDCITVTATILGISFPVLWTDICICEFSLLYCVISRRWEGNKQKYILPLQLTRSVTLNKLPFTSLSSPHLPVCVCAQLCLTLCNPTDCSPPGSFVHGILQERTVE